MRLFREYFLAGLMLAGFWSLLFSSLGCNRQVQTRFLGAEDLPESILNHARAGVVPPKNDCCNDYLSYTPDTNYLEHTPMKYIRVNVHFMNSSDSSQNFDQGKGTWLAKQLIKAANHDIETNDRLWLPYGNNIPNLPPRYRMVISPDPEKPGDNGIHFHYDDELYYYVVKGKNINRHKREVIYKYGVQLDTVLNIFIMPHHPDSMASPHYGGYGCGIALGPAVKLAGIYENGFNEWDIRYVLNHEIGHIYGLGHTWAYNDGCDDTPHNPRCWNRTDKPPCDTAASNNVMDYNALQSAWSPCQIGKMHYNMSNLNARARQYLQPNWCTLQKDADILIQDSVHWKGIKDLQGNLTIAPGGILKISCRTSIPENGKITVQAGGKLILDNALLHNSCDKPWKGIEIQEKGNRKGEVTFLGNPQIRNCKRLLSLPDEVQVDPNS